MKKIFTLFMATVVTVSMFALPQLPDVTVKKALQLKKAEVRTPAQVKAKEITRTKMLQRDFVLQENAKVASRPMAAPKKVVQAISGEMVTLDLEFYVGPEYYAEYGDWYIAVGNDDWTFKLDWYASEGENKDGYLGTWTTKDFDLGYTYIIDPDWEEIDVKDITMTVTKTVISEFAFSINLTATILASDGNTYKINAAKEVLAPKETINTEILNATYTWDGWEARLVGMNADLNLDVLFYATWATGPFSDLDVDWDLTTVSYKGQVLELNEFEMLVKATKNEAGQIGYDIELSMISTEPVLYNVHIFAPLATATDTVNVEVKNMVVEYDSYWIFMSSVTEKWDIFAGVADFEITEGTYASEDEVMFYITNLETNEFAEQIYAEATVTNDSKLGWVLNISAHCTDGKFYNVTMYKSIPTPTDTVTLRFEQPAMTAFYPQFDNDLIMMHNEDNCYLAIDIYGVEMGGSFTMDNMDMNYSMLYTDLKNYVMVDMADVQGTINQYGDTTVIAAKIISYDAVLYDVVLWHVAPSPVKTVTLDVEAEFVNKLNTEGYYLLRGYTADQQYFVSLSPLGEDIEGTFVNDGLFGKFGAEGGEYTFNGDYCYLYKYNTAAKEPVGVSMVKGQFVVTDNNGKITAIASVVGSDSVKYEISVRAEYNQYLQYDATSGSVDRTYTSKDAVTIEAYKEYESVYFEVIAADQSDICALYFYTEEFDADITIAPGVYTIDDTEDYNTVYASPGVVGTSVNPSFYALMDGGRLVTPLYMLVDGTVTVEKVEGKLKLEVNGFNSYGVPVHVVYNGADSGAYVENVNVNVEGLQKQIVDGQLVIIRDGKAYNALGAQVK